MKLGFSGLACALALLAALPASAGDSHKEAADRFDRGLRLFNQGDNANALLEFKRAYELSGEPSILLNVGLVQVELGRPVEAVEVFDRLLANPTGVSQTHLHRARQVREEQTTRIGKLSVMTNGSAQVEIDNLAVGQTPLGQPVAVASGIRLLTVVAPGMIPVRQEVSITGGQTTNISITLMPAQGALAQLVVRSILPGADVLVDGKLVGRTPLPASVALPAGSHEVSLRRPGYRSVAQTITLGEGSTGDVTLEATENPAEADLVGGLVTLDINKPDANVTIDGVPRQNVAAGLRLPAGPHRLSVMRTGFLPFERELSVDKGLPRTVRIQLEPTEEVRSAHLRRTSAQRRNAYITMGAGLAVGAVGGYLIYAARQDQKKADEAYDEVKPLLQDGKSCGGNLQRDPDCQIKVDRVNKMQDDANLKKWIGWGVAGAGAAALVTGLVLRLLADNPDDFQVASHPLQPYAWTTPTGGGVGLGGRF
jgi:hypothetical protein